LIQRVANNFPNNKNSITFLQFQVEELFDLKNNVTKIFDDKSSTLKFLTVGGLYREQSGIYAFKSNLPAGNFTHT
jgi:hypothetical protein